MVNYTNEELDEALRSITSTLSKSEKVQLKLKEGTSQYTTIVKEIVAYNISIELIKKEMEKSVSEKVFTKDELVCALQSISLVTSKVEKILPKFNPGTSQHTLAIRRIKAFDIATKLIMSKLNLV